MSEPLSHPVGVLHEIRWREICPWLILVRALRVSLLVRVLVLATVGTWFAAAGTTAIERLLIDPTDTEAVTIDAADEPFSAIGLKLISKLEVPPSSPMLVSWYRLTEPFLQLSNRQQTWQSSLGWLLCGVWNIAIWAVFGGAIARIAALYLTRGETPGPITALWEAISVWTGTAGAPLIVLLFAIAVGIPLVLLGLLLRFDLVAVIAGLLWCVVLIGGLTLAAVLIGLLFGWPLMWSCQAVERSDAFDGVSRCYAYVYQRPLHLIFFLLVASVFTLLGSTAVSFVGTAAIDLTEWTVSWGAGTARAEELFASGIDTQSQTLAARAIAGWKQCLMSVVDSYPLACIWPMAVGMYLLLRRLIDGTEMDEVSLSDGSSQIGLPALKPTDLGVPAVERRSTNGDGEGKK